MLACGSLFVHDGCTFYGFGSPDFQGSERSNVSEYFGLDSIWILFGDLSATEQDHCMSKRDQLKYQFSQTMLGTAAGIRKGKL